MDKDVELLARIIEHTPIGIVILKPDRSILYVNTLATHLFNTSKEMLLGSSIDHYIVDRQGITSWRELWSEIRQGKLGETKVTIPRGQYDEIVCTLTAFYLGGKQGQQDSMALIFRDITHELKIAEQLEKKNVEMAKMNTDLIRSNVDLKRLSEMKSNFLSIASHELKTPLTSIKGYSDIIIDSMKDRIDEAVYRMIESINRAADRLNKVINNILDVTRIEQKRLRLKPEEFDLTIVANDCIAECSLLASKREITFNKDFAGNLPLFFGDRVRMHQVFTNLFSNAIKFSPDKSVVEVAIVLDEGDRFHVTIKDRGIGIDRNEQKHIFDPFYEVGDISKHSTDHVKFMGGGMGLGLSIVKGIVERHGGRIWVESEGMRPQEFRGSTFHVVLRVRSEIDRDDFERDAPKTAPAAVHDLLLNAPGISETKPPILLIDYDRETVEIGRMVLEHAFEVIAAPTSELGLSLAFQYKPVAILLDANMPGLDGLRLCSILRSQEETRDIPIVFLSAAAPREEIERYFAAGADDFIVKPFSGRELMDKIWKLFMKKKEEALH